MIAQLVSPNPDIPRRPLLGLPVGIRAMWSAADAGASGIELAGQNADQLQELAEHARPRVRCSPSREARATERLVLRADAVVSPALIRDLQPHQAIVTERGQAVAARVSLDHDQDPLDALQAAAPRPWQEDRYRYAIELEGARDFRKAEKAVLRSLVKPSDGPVSRHFNRHISLAITRLLVPLGVSPNQITVLVALAGIAAAWFASLPTWAMHVAGAALFQVHSIIDGCDGEIARLTRRGGRHGALVDSLVDDVSNLLFFVGLSVGVGRCLEVSWPLITGGVTALSYAAVAAVQYGGTAAAGREAAAAAKPFGDKTGFWKSDGVRPGAGSGLARLLVALFRRDVFVVLILAGVALGLAPVVVAIFPLVGVGALVASVRRVTANKAT